MNFSETQLAFLKTKLDDINIGDVRAGLINLDFLLEPEDYQAFLKIA